MRSLILAVGALLLSAPAARPPAVGQGTGGAGKPALDFDVYRTRIEPMFLVKRPGN